MWARRATEVTHQPVPYLKPLPDDLAGTRVFVLDPMIVRRSARRSGSRGQGEAAAASDIRNGTATLFAALNIATGQVAGLCQPRHRNKEFQRFLRQVARAYPNGELHLMMDNYAAHKRIEIRDWLEANPRIHVHFTPTSASWGHCATGRSAPRNRWQASVTSPVQLHSPAW